MTSPWKLSHFRAAHPLQEGSTGAKLALHGEKFDLTAFWPYLRMP